MSAESATVERTLLFNDGEAGQFRSRWSEVQAAFVDSPRRLRS